MRNVGSMTAKRTSDSDEWYTPAYAVRPLLKYLATTSYHTIWCPFDTPESEYVKIFVQEGYNVLYSNISAGQNFFEYEPKELYDIIISNPPYSCKDEIIARLWELNKPYAVLMPIPALQGQKRFPFMRDCQALIFDKRIHHYTDLTHTTMGGNSAFGSFYLCRKFLPKDLIFEELDVS